MASASDVARPGRPPKVDDAGIATRERLLLAAVAACVQHGFDGTTVTDIAQRADVSAPAIYNHFGGKVELLVVAGEWALDRLRPDVGVRLSPAELVYAFMADGFRDSRRLLVELHLAGQRHPEVAASLVAWHREHADQWTQRLVDSGAAANADEARTTVVTFFAVLLGLCQLDSLVALGVSTDAVAGRTASMVGPLFATRPRAR